jgi:hypothetical protein
MLLSQMASAFLLFTCRDANWLNFLYYTDPLWNAMYSMRGNWTNRRLREPNWRELFEREFRKVAVQAKPESHLSILTSIVSPRCFKNIRYRR